MVVTLLQRKRRKIQNKLL